MLRQALQGGAAAFRRLPAAAPRGVSTAAASGRRWARLAAAGGAGYGALALGGGWAVRADGAAAESVPAFEPSSSRFDQSQFGGRLQQIIAQLDPMKLLVSSADIDAAKALVKAYKEGKRDPSTTDAELWAAKELIECRIHPDTGELTPTLFCFAAYTPMQPPMIVGLLTASTPMTVAFWQ